MAAKTTSEHVRLGDARGDWLRWGPYLSERAWATVREDYSADANVWGHFPHDHARSRAFRWNEDGLGGICDDRQRLCLAFSFWNGRDPILKERVFGLTGDEGNHGEDAKEYWWYLDSTPSHSWMTWAYAYPQSEFPYEELVKTNAKRGRSEREYELADTGALDGGFWDIVIDYAKADTDDIVARVTVTNTGEEADTIHVLPTLWFRNTWRGQHSPPQITRYGDALVASGSGPTMRLTTTEPSPTALFCDNETNAERCGGATHSEYPKDGINDHVVNGDDTVNPDETGTKASFWFQREVAAGESTTFTVRLSNAPLDAPADSPDRVIDVRRREADEFYDTVIPADTSDEDRRIARQAFAGMMWGKQFYNFDVLDWLEGDGTAASESPYRPPRNAEWQHLNCADIISMPDPWEYPWFAAWDLAFHCIPMAHIDPQFAKDQLLVLMRNHFIHPNGQLPAYEWAFSDVNPPVHASAAMTVFQIDGCRDLKFLAAIFNKLLLNFSWWINRRDEDGRNVFDGGFLGLDNISPIDRSEGVPAGYRLEQSDSTAWMATFALRMLEMALLLRETDDIYAELPQKFFDHFAAIAKAIHEQGLWNEQDGFYYDVLQGPEHSVPFELRSMVGLIPLFAVSAVPTTTITTPTPFADHFMWFITERGAYARTVLRSNPDMTYPTLLFSIAGIERLERICERLFDENEMLSPYGIRSLSAAHRDDPFTLDVPGVKSTVGYVPGESNTPMFGGNSNWRGPIWFPVNHLLIESLQTFAEYGGDNVKIEFPTGSGTLLPLSQITDALRDRMIDLFRRNPDGLRPADTDQRIVDDRVLFYEYFDGDTGRGLGASHQTGWTGLVADLIVRRPPANPPNDA